MGNGFSPKTPNISETVRRRAKITEKSADNTSFPKEQEVAGFHNRSKTFSKTGNSATSWLTGHSFFRRVSIGVSLYRSYLRACLPVSETCFHDGSKQCKVVPVDFDRFPAWRQQTGSGVLEQSERFPVCPTCFVDGLWQFETCPVAFGCFANQGLLWNTTSGLLPPRLKTHGVG